MVCESKSSRVVESGGTSTRSARGKVRESWNGSARPSHAGQTYRLLPPTIGEDDVPGGVVLGHVGCATLHLSLDRCSRRKVKSRRSRVESSQKWQVFSLAETKGATLEILGGFPPGLSWGSGDRQKSGDFAGF